MALVAGAAYYASVIAHKSKNISAHPAIFFGRPERIVLAPDGVNAKVPAVVAYPYNTGISCQFCRFPYFSTSSIMASAKLTEAYYTCLKTSNIQFKTSVLLSIKPAVCIILEDF